MPHPLSLASDVDDVRVPLLGRSPRWEGGCEIGLKTPHIYSGHINEMPSPDYDAS